MYNPTETGTHIGVQNKRFQYLDVALARPDLSSNFDTSNYISSPSTKDVYLSGNKIELRTWFSVDGMSTGMVFS